MKIQLRLTNLNRNLFNTTNMFTIMGSNLFELAHRSMTVETASFPKFDIFKPLRKWLDNLDVASPQLAHKLCRVIPAQCPFERDLKLFGHVLLHIPPMCKLNPVYDEVVTLRFRAMCYLADECGEDISQYC
jgi:Mo-dependent nitrogenase C-terminus